MFVTQRPSTVDGSAIVTFVLALTSFVLWIAPAIVALVLAPYAKRRVRSFGGSRRGIGLITAAQIISAISLAIGVIVLAILPL
jgi:hypothetical protein